MEELLKKIRLQQIKICQLKKNNIDAVSSHKKIILYLYEVMLQNLPDDKLTIIMEDIKNELKKINM